MTTDQTVSIRISDYATTEVVCRLATQELVDESEEAAPSGAVPAYVEDGVAHYVRPDAVEQARAQGHTVITVYVDP